MAELSMCKSCGAEIRWIKSANLRNMPVDADPVEDGNLQVDWERGDAHVLPRHSDYSGPRYNSHFLTCPNAKQHRKPKQTAAEIDAAVDKATAALDPKKRETEPSPGPVPGVDSENLMLMLGEAIAGDVEAWKHLPVKSGPTGRYVRAMRLTWQGTDFVLRIEQVSP